MTTHEVEAKRILIVDDNRDCADALAMLLHVVILDIRMPKLSGAIDESTKVRAQMAGFAHYLPKSVDSGAVLRLLKSVQ